MRLKETLSKLGQAASWTLRIANHDFCPRLNPYAYWIKKPVVWVIAAIVFSLLAGMFVGPQGYVLAFIFLTLLILGLVWPWISMKGIRCELVLPDGRLWENQELKVIFRVQNYWPLPIFGMMVDGDFLQDDDPDEERIAFSLRKIPAWSETEFCIPITPRRRGQMPCGDVQIKNGFPFGLTDVSKTIANPGRALVWPTCETLEGHPPPEQSQLNVLGSLCDRAGNDGETIGVRAYQEGDRLRNIHWAQSVRCQQLMVRERQTLSSTAATVMLDLTPDHHVGRGVQSSYEWAIRIAATICYQLHRDQSQVGIICLGVPCTNAQSADNRYGVRRLMDFFAELPTLDVAIKLTQEAHSILPLRHSASVTGRRFFVGTSQSTGIANLTPDVESIVISLNGFVSDELEIVDSETEVPSDGSSTFVTAPHLAASQLDRAWKRSIRNVAC